MARVLIWDPEDYLEFLRKSEPPDSREVVQKHSTGRVVLLGAGAGAEVQCTGPEGSFKEQAEEMIQTRRVLDLAEGAGDAGAGVSPGCGEVRTCPSSGTGSAPALTRSSSCSCSYSYCCGWLKEGGTGPCAQEKGPKRALPSCLSPNHLQLPGSFR